METKLVWAEAQEQLVKLKRSLVKAQEKNVRRGRGWRGWVSRAPTWLVLLWAGGATSAS